MRHLVGLLVAALVAAPPDVAAQVKRGTAAPGPRIFVTLQSTAVPLEGTLLALNADTVTFHADTTTWLYPLDQVRRIQRQGDRSHDGAIRGALIGAVCIITCAQGARNAAHLRELTITNAALGAVLGWWFDRSRVGRTTIYSRELRRRP